MQHENHATDTRMIKKNSHVIMSLECAKADERMHFHFITKLQFTSEALSMSDMVT